MALVMNKELLWARELSADDPYEFAVNLMGRVGTLADKQADARPKQSCSGCVACCETNYPIVSLVEAYAITGYLLKHAQLQPLVEELEQELSSHFSLNALVGEGGRPCFFLGQQGCSIHLVRPFACTAYGLFRPTDGYCPLAIDGKTHIIKGTEVDAIYELYSRFTDLFIERTGMYNPYARLVSVYVYDIIRHALDPTTTDGALITRGLSLVNFYPWAYTGLPARYWVYDARLIDKQRLHMIGEGEKIKQIELEEIAEGKYLQDFKALNAEIRAAIEKQGVNGR